MKYRKLGHTGLDVSTIACGSWQLGGKRWKGLSDKDTVSLFHTCLDRGINLYDVSTAYGQYEDHSACFHSRSQELLGKAFENKRDEVIINLKLGHLDEYTHRRNFSPSYLVRSFKQSLKRLKTDYVDICLIHAPSIADIEEERPIRILQTLQELGLVGAIGYSLENEPEHLKIALKQDIDVVELQYNLISQECGEAIEEARKHGIGIIASGVYKRGLLTGRFRGIDDLPLHDEYWQYNRNLCERKLVSLLETSSILLDHYGSPFDLKKAALGFVLNHPGVSTAVMGHRAVEELDQNIEIANKCFVERSTEVEDEPTQVVEEKILETA